MIDATSTPRPYAMVDHPTSSGRLFLARAFQHWCALHHGYSEEEIETALNETSREGSPNETRRSTIVGATRILGSVFADGIVPTFARPFVGGEPIALPAAVWEVDDFRARFSRSALDPARPYDPTAAPTHWLFVDRDAMNAVFEASCAEHLPARPATVVRKTAPAAAPVAALEKKEDDGRLLRLDEVLRLTGMSKSTVYRRMEAGRFPQSVEMGGNITGWREADVRAWLRSPR